MKKIIKIFAFLLCILCLVPSFAACGTKTLMTYEDKELSVNVYEFLLSRMKGNLAYYGYDVEKDTFWNTVKEMDETTHLTYDEFFCRTIEEEAKKYIIADKLFDELGLDFRAEDEERVDKLLAAYEERAGSRSNLNAELKEFGVNYNILREIYVIEMKIILIKAHLYGENGEKLTREQKDKYLNDNYVAFRQIFLATYEYVTVKDLNGDVIYCTDDKYTAIAYDKVNGAPKKNEFGRDITDDYGNTRYYTADGKVAYDRVNGVIKYKLDDEGKKVIANISDEEKAELYDRAKQYAKECNADPTLFDEYLKKYDESENGELSYLNTSPGFYSAQDSAYGYLDEISKKLLGLENGECAVYESGYGYHVIRRYEPESGAYDKKENKDDKDDKDDGNDFPNFYENLIDELFNALCNERAGSVKTDEDTLRDAPTMKDVGTNTLY